MTTISHPSLLSHLVVAFRQWLDPVDRTTPARAEPASRAAPHRKGHVSLVGAGPGSADLITLRGLLRLQAADAVFYDRLADPALLDQLRPGCERVYVGKAPGCHSMSQSAISALLVETARRGKQVVRLKCGDPGIFGRGAEEAGALDAAGIDWDIIPGVTAACAAAASARSFLTERGVTNRLVLATGHRQANSAPQDWSAGATPGTTLACYMGIAEAASIRHGMLEAGWPADSPVQIVSKAQTPFENVIDCALDRLEAVCTQQPGLNPAILLIRWPVAPTPVSVAARQPGVFAVK